MQKNQPKTKLSRELSSIIQSAAGAPVDASVTEQIQVLPKLSDEAGPAIDLLCPADGVTEEGEGRADFPQRVCGAHERRSMKGPAFLLRGRTYFSPRMSGPVLAFDIETTGVSSEDTVTCVSAYDPDRSIELCACTPDGACVREFVRLLDDAPLLCGFNAARFDIPFLCRCWGLPREQAGRWAAKLIDPYESSRLALGKTFPLNALLAANGLESKTGCGSEAVLMARQGRWDELTRYCLSDTVKTHQLVKLGTWLIPK